jgi:uncharacterized protein
VDELARCQARARVTGFHEGYLSAFLFVNLFIPSEVTWGESRMTLRQTTGFPDEPATHLQVISGAARIAVRVRIPSWAARPARARLNGAELPQRTAPGGWLVIRRHWRVGDTLDVSLPMTLALDAAPDKPAVQAVTYGPVVLSGGYGTRADMPMPVLNTGSLTLAGRKPLMFQASTSAGTVPLIPIARMHHEHYNVYWLT